MNLVRPVKVTKVRQTHAAKPLHKPGQPSFGANYVSPRAASAKKTAGRTARSRKTTKVASAA